jgi:hypothetical protein
MKYRSYGQILGDLSLDGESLEIHIIDCHIIVEVKRALRPKRRNKTVGDALMKASTIGFDRPEISASKITRYP